MEKVGLPLPTTDVIETKTKEIEKAKAYEFTDKQIDQVIQTSVLVVCDCHIPYCCRLFKRRRSSERTQGTMP